MSHISVQRSGQTIHIVSEIPGRTPIDHFVDPGEARQLAKELQDAADAIDPPTIPQDDAEVVL